MRVGPLLLLFALGCGPAPIDQTHEGTLDDADAKLRVDQSPYEPYEVELGAGWRVIAEMRSTAFDPYLHLIDPQNQQLEQNDDAAPSTHDARIEHVVTE